MAKVKNKKQELSPEEMKQQIKEKTAQQWMPIADIEDTIFYRKDDFIAAMIRIQPENIDLLSDNEKRRKIESLSEGFNGEKEPFQIFCVGRPVDLNNYLESLQEKAKMEQDFTKKMLLKGYIQQASQTASSGEAIERRFYIVVTKKITDAKSENELINRVNELQVKLMQAELTCDSCQDDEIMDVFCLFASPIQAAFEKSEIELDLPTVLMN